jgi:uncharacterized protein YkwD
MAAAACKRTTLVIAGALLALAFAGTDPAAAGASAAGGAAAAAPAVCADTQLLPNAANLARVRRAALCLINQQRAIRGVKPLKSRARLRAVALRRSRDMVNRHYFSHPTAPGGGLNPDFLHLGLRDASRTGENIAWGRDGLSTAQSIIAGWMSSTRHRRNMLAKRFRFTGIGIAIGAPKVIDSTGIAATYTEVFSTR